MLTVAVAPGAERTGFVFPPEIETREWVGYHGTSSAYSARIEREGFARVKPIADQDLQLVCDLAARFGTDPDGDVAGFRSMSSISFFPVSVLALAFAVPGSAAGQGVGFARAHAQTLIDRHQDALSADEFDALRRIVRFVDEARAAPPVIYAVDLAGLEHVRLGAMTSAIHVEQDIPVSRILACATVPPSGIDFGAIDQKKLKNDIRLAHLTGQPAWLTQMPRR